MKDIDTLEAQFKAELVAALQRAANGRSPLVFSLKDERSRSSARKLRTKAQRIMELRQSYSVDHSVRSPAASYLATCLRWEHGSTRETDLAQKLAKALLHELKDHAA
jgi:hypothetical protein